MCYNKLMVKKGDTLVEVTLAVGIFSMIAIAVVAVMSSGTSGAQTALEATLTREEIDSQAEALRFIQNSAINGDERYEALWNKITDNAYELKDTAESRDISAAILQFAPQSCDALYNNSSENSYYIASQNAFIINTHGLGEFSNAEDFDSNQTNLIDSVFIPAKKSILGDELDEERFGEAITYPHLIFKENETSDLDSDSETLISNGDTVLARAEGIYIVAVKDKDKTTIGEKKESAFYDFYIRTCWYGSNDQTPSTISTVIRLYDPNVMK